VEVAGWPTTDALTDGVNFRLLNFRSGEYLGQHPWMQAVVTGDRGALLLSGSRNGHRFVATGFNPFPYLGRQNLPMSILTLNMLGYLAGFGAQTSGYRTGEPWMVPAGSEDDRGAVGTQGDGAARRTFHGRQPTGRLSIGRGKRAHDDARGEPCGPDGVGPNKHPTNQYRDCHNERDSRKLDRARAARGIFPRRDYRTDHN